MLHLHLLIQATIDVDTAHIFTLYYCIDEVQAIVQTRGNTEQGIFHPF